MAWVIKTVKVRGTLQTADPAAWGAEAILEFLIDPKDAPFDYKARDRLSAVAFREDDIPDIVRIIGRETFARIMEEGAQVKTELPVTYHDFE
jgi:hypothetical protein